MPALEPALIQELRSLTQEAQIRIQKENAERREKIEQEQRTQFVYWYGVAKKKCLEAAQKGENSCQVFRIKLKDGNNKFLHLSLPPNSPMVARLSSEEIDPIFLKLQNTFISEGFEVSFQYWNNRDCRDRDEGLDQAYFMVLKW